MSVEDINMEDYETESSIESSKEVVVKNKEHSQKN